MCIIIPNFEGFRPERHISTMIYSPDLPSQNSQLETNLSEMSECKPMIHLFSSSPKYSISWILIIWAKMRLRFIRPRHLNSTSPSIQTDLELCEILRRYFCIPVLEGFRSTKTECDYFNDWIKKKNNKKKNGHIRKNLFQNGEPQRSSWGMQKKKKESYRGRQ